MDKARDWIRGAAGDSLKALEELDYRHTPLSAINLFHERSEYLKVISTADWDGLKKMATDTIQTRLAGIDKLLVLQSKLSPSQEKLSLVPKVFQHLPPLPKISDQAAKTIFTHLKKRGITEAKAKSTVKAFSRWRDNERKALDRLLENVNESIAKLNHAYVQHLTSLMGAIFANAVADFNLANVNEVKINLTSQQSIRKVDNILQRHLRQIWSGFNRGDLLGVQLEAADLVNDGQASVKLFLKQAAIASHERNSKKNSSTSLTKLSHELSKMLRVSFESVAAGFLVSWVAGWNPAEKLLKSWLARGQSTQFVKRSRSDRQLLQNITKKANGRQGKAVLIEGVVIDIVIRHTPKGVRSWANILDSHKRQVVLAIPYFKIDSGGLVTNSVVRAMGRPAGKLDWLDNKDAVVLERLSLKEIARSSWLHWLETQTNQVFSAYPHRLAFDWSWELGKRGPGNQLIYGTWYEHLKH